MEKEERTPQIQSLTVAKKYHPVWFSRMEDGYTGTNYEDALVFCARQVDMMIPCPYEAMCPMGPDTAPSGGYRQSDPVGTPQWAPIIDYVNSPPASVLADKQPDDAKETTEQELESLQEKVDATQAEHNRESHRNPPN